MQKPPAKKLVAEVVLDASVVLAHLGQEPGWEAADAIVAAGAAIGAVNLSEVVAKLAERGWTDSEIFAGINEMSLEAIPFDAELAYAAGLLRPTTRRAGLSLGDRACLALAAQLNLPAVTADRSWLGLGLPVTVQIVR